MIFGSKILVVPVRNSRVECWEGRNVIRLIYLVVRFMEDVFGWLGIYHKPRFYQIWGFSKDERRHHVGIYNCRLQFIL